MVAVGTSLVDVGRSPKLKKAAQVADCDFEGFGLHLFRRANITWRQEVGGSSIEAPKIAGHATVSVTGDHTIMGLRRHEEYTRAIQDRLAAAGKKVEQRPPVSVPPSSTAPDVPPTLAEAEPLTAVVQ